MRTILLAGCLFLTVSCVPVRAGLNINTEGIKKAVVFIYGSATDGSVDASKPDATGFFVEVPTLDTPPRYYRLLVTARHVFDPRWAQCSYPNPEQLFVRLNKRGEGVAYIPIKLIDGGRSTYAVGSDDSDVALLVLSKEFDTNEYDFDSIALSSFGTPEQIKNLSVGDDLTSAGLMPFYTGVNHSYPIFKFGKISNIPDETVPAACEPGPGRPTRAMKLWLIAANLFPGSSGSPIFFVPFGANGISLGSSTPFLVGLQSTSFVLADVAGMTPVQGILDTIKMMNLPNVDLSPSTKPAVQK